MDRQDVNHWIKVGLDFQRRGKHHEATSAFERASLLDSGNPITLGRVWNSVCKSKDMTRFLLFCRDNHASLAEAHVDFYLANAHERLKDMSSAEAAAAVQCDRHPTDFNSIALLARLQMRQAKFGDALTNYSRADAIRPGSQAVQIGIGICQRKLGNVRAALEALEAGSREYPYVSRFWSERAICHQTLADPTSPCATEHAILAELTSKEARRVAHEVNAEVARLQLARELETREALHRDAIGATFDDGLVLEFGVASGVSLRLIAQALPNCKVYGFDSFQGLPEAWEHKEAGTFRQSELPTVSDNTTLVVGWFEDTLDKFLAETPGNVRYLHMDSDLYSSTKYVLERLAPRIVPGTVMVFDEYWRYSGWVNHEFRAMQEFCQLFDVTYQILGTVAERGEVAMRIASIAR